jgi:hypothetical protein
MWLNAAELFGPAYSSLPATSRGLRQVMDAESALIHLRVLRRDATAAS